MRPQATPFLAAALLVLSPCPEAQRAAHRPVPLPVPLAESMGLAGGSLQRLTLPEVGWHAFELELALGDESCLLLLRPHDLRSVGLAMGNPRAPGSAGARSTYRGVVLGRPDARVAMSLLDGRLSGAVLLAERTWVVQPAADALGGAARGWHVVYERTQALPMEGDCATVAVATEESAGGPGRAAPRRDLAPANPGRVGPARAELALELDPPFRALWPSDERAVAEALAVVNAVDLIFTRDLGITLEVSALVLRDRSYSTGAPQLIFEMADLWNARAPLYPRDVTHLLSGVPSSSVLGIAFTSQVCFPESQYSVAWLARNFTDRVTVTAHELGHSFGAGHCDGRVPCYLMCSQLGGCDMDGTQFAPASIQEIGQLVATLSCFE